MPMRYFFNPAIFGTEFLYTITIVFLCFLVYYKTKDIYNLTKYKGIGYFRNAFLFFGLAYASRFLLHLLTLTISLIFDYFIPRMQLFPLVMIFVGYFSTMAIFYLTYSTVWKRIEYKHFIIFSNTIAVLVSLIAFISRSNILLSMIQFILLAFTVIISNRKHKKIRKKSNAKTLYLLISLFWLINLFLLGPHRFMPFDIKVIFQAISIAVFVVIYHKAAKWIK